MSKAVKFSLSKFEMDRVQIVIFTIHFVLMLSALYMFYQSFMLHSYLKDSENYTKVIKQLANIEEIDRNFIQNDINSQKNEQVIVMFISFIVFSITLFMLFQRNRTLKNNALEENSFRKFLESLSRLGIQGENEANKVVDNNHRIETYSHIVEQIRGLEEKQRLSDEANKTKSLFLANMSHEIRTPLNGIVGFTKFLTSTELNKEQHEFVQIIRKSSEDLLTIINDILDISKIENGHIELEEIFFNPMEEFENVIESYAANASKKDIDFSLWIDPTFQSLLLRSDPGKIKQVMINLISNAVKFTENKGTIDVTIEQVDSIGDDMDVKFSVKDTGVGISKENEAKIFEAFTQAESNTSRKYGGTGLGLTISAGLVNALGGALCVDSTLGEGSTFFFTLKIPCKSVDREKRKVKRMKVGFYTPKEVELKSSNQFVDSYLKSYEQLDVARFSSFEECLEFDATLLDALYIHFDKVNQPELEALYNLFAKQMNVILITKLKKREIVQSMPVELSHVIYEPITFSKIEKSFHQIIDDKKRRDKRQSQSIKNKTTMENTPMKGHEDMKRFDGIKSLVVEDNPINQKMILHILKNLGISSECADDGKMGFEMYMQNHERYDVVFMDIQMPVMNGIESTQAIKAFVQRQNLPAKPIIAVTANALKGDKEHFMSEGLDEYVSKPIDLDKFITVLKKFFKETVPKEPKTSEVPKTDILLYKQTMMEAKIISAILDRLDYSVDVVNNLDELKREMDTNSHRCVLLDKVTSEIDHLHVTQHIKHSKIPSLLFVDAEELEFSNDRKDYTFILNKVTDYKSIKSKVDHMIAMTKVS